MNGEQIREHEQPTIGQSLERARKERGFSLKEVEQAIKIHTRHLEALERGDSDSLPSPAWRRGFLITYATYLGLDCEALGLGAVAPFPGPASKRSRRRGRYLPRRWLWVAGPGIFVLAAAIVIVLFVAPYSALTNRVTDFLGAVAPEIFLDGGPQRIAILGSSGEEIARTNNVMVVKVGEDDLGMLAIPQNTLTEIPGGYGTGDLTHAFMIGGPDLTRRTAVRFTGTEVQHYLVVSAEGIKAIVESMGGVRVEVPGPMSGQSSATGSEIMVRSGPQTLNGDQALVYYLGKDEWSGAERTKHQLDFLYVMYRQAFGPLNLLSNPGTLSVVFEHTETDMSVIQSAQLAARVRTLGSSGVSLERGAVPGREESVHDQQEGTRVTYWVPDTQELPAVLNETVR